MGGVKSWALRALVSRPVQAATRRLLKHAASIFMFHRFAVPQAGVAGHEPAEVRRFLGFLRKRRYPVLGLEDLFRRFASRQAPLRGAVCFTIDDGYFDHAEVAAPLFAEFDCPVTTFVTTGFLDGRLWFWWDRIEFVFEHTRCSNLQIELGDGAHSYGLGSPQERAQAKTDFTARCKRIPEPAKLEAILALSRAAEVDLPSTPPTRYAPMSWSQLRQSQGRGMTFGPHTITHPILARTDDAQAREEVAGSWRRLNQEARGGVPVFCYPNGGLEDFGPREIAVLQELGFLGGVTGVAGYAGDLPPDGDGQGRFLVRRFPYPDDFTHALQYAGGLERGKAIVRGLVR
jgi:peptidoglycan/xylan/chitin deacetylase (PgdA/CDA1 family)